MTILERVKEQFSRDRFAINTGIEILQADVGHAVCVLPLRDEHMNANDVPMGGVIFTLADFTFAVAANAGRDDGAVVSQQMSITFLSPARGRELRAEARCIKAGRRTCLYEICVTDELGTKVAHTTGNGFTAG